MKYCFNKLSEIEEVGQRQRHKEKETERGRERERKRSVICISSVSKSTPNNGVMVGKLDCQIMVSGFDSHWVAHTSGLVLQLSLGNNYLNESTKGNKVKS